MPEFDFDGFEASHYANKCVEGRMSRADTIRCLVIEGADEDEATEFIDATIAYAIES